MRRYGVLLMVLVLATASLLAAAAYNTAVVTNAAELKVAATNQALLALGAHGGVGNKDKTAEVIDGNLVFELGRGNNPSFGGDQSYGLQKNSVYTWWRGGDSNTGMFYIQNRSAETIELTLRTTNVPAGVTIEVNQSMGDGGSGWQDVTNATVTFPRHLSSGNTCDVGVRISVDGTATMTTTTTMQMIVGATAL